MNYNSFFLKSMTGYGRGLVKGAVGSIEIEIASVNRRHLEIQINLPSLLHAFESDLRRQVAKAIGRGQVNLSVFFQPPPGAIAVIPNMALALALKEGYLSIAQALGLKEELTLRDFVGQKDLFLPYERQENKEELSKALENALRQALDNFVQMRQEEGSWLALDLSKRVAVLKALMERIEKEAVQLPEMAKERLQKRLQAVFSGELVEDDERLNKEIALLVDKMDISEEIVRFKGHLNAFAAHLSLPFEEGQAKGKKLDFLIQELLRETNTIASKAQSYGIAHCTVELKCELEKMREQVQNIE